MRPCEHCVRGRKQCLIGSGSDRCSGCIETGRKCDLVVSPLEMRRVEKRRQDLWSEIKTTQAKLSRLHAQYDSVENEKKRLVDRELKNIQELEGDVQSSSVSDDLMFNVSSEQFDFPVDFDWNAFPISHETVAEAPGSSQGS